MSTRALALPRGPGLGLTGFVRAVEVFCRHIVQELPKALDLIVLLVRDRYTGFVQESVLDQVSAEDFDNPGESGSVETWPPAQE